MQKHLLSLTLNLLKSPNYLQSLSCSTPNTVLKWKGHLSSALPLRGLFWHTGMLYLHRRHSEITLSRQLPIVVGYGLWLDVLCVWIRWKYLEKHRSHTKCHTKWTANIWLEVNIFSGINSCDQLTPNLFQLLMQKKEENSKNIFISWILYVCSTCHKSESSKPWGFQRKTGLCRDS